MRENFRLIFYIIGVLLVILGVAMLLPASIDAYFGNPDWTAFLTAGGSTVLAGGLLFFVNRSEVSELSIRQSFLLTSFTWLVIGGFAALPLYFSNLGLSYTDALFESIAGLTTTGSTVLSGLDGMPPGILLWRALLQWIGGIGIIVLAVGIFPLMGVGGMRLFYTESSDQSVKPMPRIRKIALTLSLVYVGITLLCAGSYFLGGMSVFDAVAHAMTTVSTGGYSTSDSSIGHFKQPSLQWICILFMILGSLPYVLYIRTLRGDRAALVRDSQVRSFIGFVLAATLVLTLWIWGLHMEPFLDAFRHVAFHVTSVVTTTGFSTTDYSLWGTLAFDTFFFLLFIGGCSGSTASGIKIFRFQVMFSLIRIHFMRLLYPSIIVFPKFNEERVPDTALQSVMTFFTLYLVCTCAIALGLSTLGLDFITSASGAATAIANVGPGLGDIIGPGGNFSSLPDAAKWLLSFGMILGRLEIFTVLILFSPRFWKE